MKRENIILLFIFIACIQIGYPNNTRTGCEELLNLAKEEYLNKNYTKSLEIFTKAKILSEDNNWRDLQATTLNGMGIVYSEISDHEKAIDCFLESYKIAINESNQKVEIAILNNISQLYFMNGEMTKAMQYVNKAYDIAKQLNDSMMMGRYASNLAKIANETNDFQQTEKYSNIAIALTTQTKDTLTLFSAKLTKADYLCRKKEYNAAEELIMEVLDQCHDIQYDEVVTNSFLLLSQIYQQKGNFQKAIYFGHKSLNMNPNLSMKMEIYNQLSDLYQDSDSPFLALKYKDSLLIAKDSLSKINDRSQIMNHQIQFDLINSEKKLEENRIKQKAERMLYISMILFIFILSLILIWVLRIQSIKNKQRKIITELKLKEEKNEKLLLTQQLNEEKILALLEHARLNNEIDTKNRQLIGKALYQSNRNELIKDIVKALSKITPENVDSVLRIVISQLKAQLKESAKDEGLFVYFEQVNPVFLSALKKEHPDLSANDVRLLSFFYLNLNTKEIATLLNILPDSLKKKKQRLASKLGVETADLYKYLANLS